MIDKYSKLNTVYQLQKNLARQSMHNAKSPITAISGYLELINLLLYKDIQVDRERIANYRQKIESGVYELNNILIQLQQLYCHEEGQEVEEYNACVELNWFIRDFCSMRESSATTITPVCSTNPIYVETEIFKAKLILSNLVNFAEKSSSHSTIKIETNKLKNRASVAVQFQSSNVQSGDLENLLNSDSDCNSRFPSNSFSKGLAMSARLAEQINCELKVKGEIKDTIAIYLTLPLYQEE